ncbi:15384_t:CDS:2, partial [Dentiscutata heterogama]
LSVQLPVFHGKQDENVMTWLLQVDLLYKARKIENEERLQYIITGLKDAALQWYLNKVQAYTDQTLFESWKDFSKEIKLAFQPPQHQQYLRNILGQVESMDEADKILYFTEGLKAATKAEVSYRSPENLEEAIRLATT